MHSIAARWVTVALWLALAPLLISVGMRRGFREGAITEVDITLVAADAQGLACSLEEKPWGYACEYRAGGRERQPDGTLVPALTLDRLDLLVPELFAQAAVRDVVANNTARGALQERFVAKCRVRVLQRVRGVQRRFSATAAFEAPSSAWLVWPLGCTAHPDRG